ncbi:hypothetical protein [Rhizobium sp. CG5]|uniref:hypothetical protein n=1 Tax=Rhizobium sp. CG5 TaxID=2726076 RepID=UPI0020335451|nr:hypothetical protein [Rhizobium sp. CG5]
MDTEPQALGPVVDIIPQTGIRRDPLGSTFLRIEEGDRDIAELLFLDLGYRDVAYAMCLAFAAHGNPSGSRLLAAEHRQPAQAQGIEPNHRCDQRNRLVEGRKVGHLWVGLPDNGGDLFQG